MRTIARAADLASLIRRMRMVRPESPPRWGRMSAHQMVCHLGDVLCLATGEKSASEATGLMQRTVIKWIAVYAPVRWPPGISTRPELDQEIGGTRPREFDRDVGRVESLLHTIARDARTVWPAHPVFGRMSRRGWLRWAYVHTDHHLRQFGA